MTPAPVRPETFDWRRPWLRPLGLALPVLLLVGVLFLAFYQGDRALHVRLHERPDQIEAHVAPLARALLWSYGVFAIATFLTSRRSSRAC